MNNDSKVDVIFQQALKHHKEKRFDVAEKLYKQILIIDANNINTIFSIGALYAEIKNFDKAKKYFHKGIKINPNLTFGYFNLALMHQELSQYQSAIVNYLKAIQIDVKNYNAYNNIAICYENLKDYTKSIFYFEKTINANPNFVEAYINISIIYKKINKLDISKNWLFNAIKIDNQNYKIYFNLAAIYKLEDNLDKAIEFYQKSLQLNKKHYYSFYNLGNLYREIREFDKAIFNYNEALKLKNNFTLCYTNLLLATAYSENNKNYLKDAKNFSSFLPTYNTNKLSFKSSSEKELKIGFVSPDLRNHPVGFFTKELFVNLKKKNVKIYCYYNNDIKDYITKSISQVSEKFVNINKINDLELINTIRKDQLDLLIDLAGITEGNRLAIFKNKCAPLQATWCGWVATTGIEEIDYIFGDPYVTPIGDQHKFSEKIAQINKIWISLSKSTIPSNIEFNENTNRNVTFGSCNNICKINDKVINAWSTILKNTGNSRLILKYHSIFGDSYIKKSIIEKFINFGAKENQIIFDGNSPRKEYFEKFNNIDIALDPFPYNGGTTSFETSYMGVPLLTMKNKTYIMRYGESINHNLGMNDWIADDIEDYINKGINFADKNFLTKLKKEHRNKAQKSILFDTSKYSDDYYNLLLKIIKK